MGNEDEEKRRGYGLLYIRIGRKGNAEKDFMALAPKVPAIFPWRLDFELISQSSRGAATFLKDETPWSRVVLDPYKDYSI